MPVPFVWHMDEVVVEVCPHHRSSSSERERGRERERDLLRDHRFTDTTHTHACDSAMLQTIKQDVTFLYSLTNIYYSGFIQFIFTYILFLFTFYLRIVRL